MWGKLPSSEKDIICPSHLRGHPPTQVRGPSKMTSERCERGGGGAGTEESDEDLAQLSLYLLFFLLTVEEIISCINRLIVLLHSNNWTMYSNSIVSVGED